MDVDPVNFPAISAAALSGKSFMFGRVDGSSIGRVTLAADGSISGYRNPNEHAWSVRDGRLIFSSIEGAATTIFAPVQADDGSYAFHGAFLPMGPGLWHTLREIAKPPPRIIEELGKELYGSDTPLAHADPRYRDDGYPHTNDDGGFSAWSVAGRRSTTGSWPMSPPPAMTTSSCRSPPPQSSG